MKTNTLWATVCTAAVALLLTLLAPLPASAADIRGSADTPAASEGSVSWDEGLTLIEVNPEDGIPLTDEEVEELLSSETIEAPAPGSVTYLSPTPANGSSMIQPLTNQIACGTRKDFYRIFSPNGLKTCFANAGKVAIGGNLNAQILCPGANRGQIYYLYQNKYYYSTWRGPFPAGSYDTCFDFGTTVIAKQVHIA